jgi:hypothetical protein
MKSRDQLKKMLMQHYASIISANETGTRRDTRTLFEN